MDTDETHTSPPTKTAATIVRYTKIHSSFLKYASQDIAANNLGVDSGEEPSPHAIVDAFKKRECDYKDSTSRLYRSALIHFLANSANPDCYSAIKKLKNSFDHIEDDEERIEAIDKSDKHKANVEKKRLETSIAVANGELKPNTSGQKAKNISKKDLQKLLIALSTSRSKWSEATGIWLAAAYLTGLRPIEWGTARIEFEEKDKWLIVKNAKNTNNRSHGEFRRIKLTNLKEDEFNLICKQIEEGNLAFRRGLWEDYYNGCRSFLLQTCKLLWPQKSQKPTLYTARHMFAANAKSIFGKTEVAALMGHGSDQTAGRSYAKRRHAHGGLSVEPDEGDVARVAGMNKKTDPSAGFSSILNKESSRNKNGGLK